MERAVNGMKVARIIARPSLYDVSNAGQVFAFEKLKAEIDLPCKGLIWPSLKAQLQLHIQANGGAIYNSLRWAARYGVYRLLQNSGITTYDDMRIPAGAGINQEIQAQVNAVLYEFEDSIEACAEANGCEAVEALGIILSIGTKQGSVNGWIAPVEDEKEGKQRA